MIRYADWRPPTDDAYAFRLRDPNPAPIGSRADIREVARRVLVDGDAERFDARVDRWSGPEDEVDGRQPYVAPQLMFQERAEGTFGLREMEEVLAGTVLVTRDGDGPVDYVLRDHHMLDVVLFHYAVTGELPTRLFHADRHSDWCDDAFLLRRRPPQAATWWALLAGLKRPGGAPVLREVDVVYTTSPPAGPTSTGRDVGAARRIPGSTDPADLPWPRALERLDGVDWVSLDLDAFQPAAQLRATRGMVRDPRLHRAMAAAKVRVFCLSPQFTDGGDLVAPWVVQGSIPSSTRLLNLLRGLGRT